MLRRARLAMSTQAVGATASTSTSGLDITTVNKWTVREPVSRRSYTVIRVETRSGLKGYGECAPVSDDEFAAAKAWVLGRPVTAFAAVNSGLSDGQSARAALDAAMLEVAAKAAAVPVFQFLGGPTRYKARALARISGDSDAALVRASRIAMGAGYQAFIVPVPATSARNNGQAFVDAVLGRLDGLRNATGPNADFVLDGANRLTPGDAQILSAAIERIHVLWLDEPCSRTSTAALGKIAAENVTPLGVGRHLRRASEFQDLLRDGLADIVRPDIAIAGISEIRRIAAIAETHYVAVGPTHTGGPLATAAALHLAAAIPNFFIQEIPFVEAEEDRRMRAEIVGEPVEAIRDGFANLPVGHGLGVTVNEQALERYQEKAG